MAELNIRKVLEEHGHIINKEQEDQIFKFNEAQNEVYEIIRERKKNNKLALILILKARQLGMSTFAEGLGSAICLTQNNQNMVIVTHEEKASQNLYAMSHYYYDHYPEWLKEVCNCQIVKDNQSMMSFTNGSKIQNMVASPNSKGTGRGQTISFAHLSEFDWWNGDSISILSGLLSACTKNAIVIIETTANGCGAFKKLWDEAIKDKLRGNDDGWIPCFFGWQTDSKYVMPYDGFELSKEEERIKKELQLSNEQIAWRRNMIKTRFAGDVSLFNQEFPSTPEEAFITSGKCIFDLNTINKRKIYLRENNSIKDKGYFLYKVYYDNYTNERKIKDVSWVSDYKNGYITIFEKPVKRMPYIIAIDPAGDGSDFTAGNVLDTRSSKQVAVLHNQGMSSFEIACASCCLGQYYNNALLGAETNFAPEIMSYCKELGYLNLFIQPSDNNNVQTSLEKRYGFRTTTVTRPYVISFLIDYVNNESDLINDYELLLEAENFVRIYKEVSGKMKQKEQANAGKHDDLLMSLGIALYIRDSNQQSMELLPDEEGNIEKPKSEFEKLFGSFENDFEEDREEYMTYD